MKKVTTKAYLNGEEKEIEVWIYDDPRETRKQTIKAIINGEERDIEIEGSVYDITDDCDYQLPKPMTNVFLMLLCLAITVLVGLYLYFQ